MKQQFMLFSPWLLKSPGTLSIKGLLGNLVQGYEGPAAWLCCL